MNYPDDTVKDFDILGAIRAAVDDALAPIDRRLAALETNVDLILQELRPVCQRLTSVEQRQQIGALTPIPRASLR